MMVMPCRFNSRVNAMEVLRSHADSSRSLRISMVTSVPAACHIEANSMAMAPAPIITALDGNWLRPNACVESMSRWPGPHVPR